MLHRKVKVRAAVEVVVVTRRQANGCLYLHNVVLALVVLVAVVVPVALLILVTEEVRHVVVLVDFMLAKAVTCDEVSHLHQTTRS